MIKKKLALLSALCALLTTVGFGLSYARQPFPERGRFPQRVERRDRDGELRQALRHLQAAQFALERADGGFRGHKAKAIDLTKRAIDQVEDAMRVDRR